MNLSLLIALSFLLGCQNYNANSFDKDKFGVIELTGGVKFKAAYPILQKQCMNCHRHSQWSEYTNEQDWVTNENLVTFGDPDNSQLITRIINYGGTGSNMPQGGKKLPDAEYNALKDWVTSP